MKLKQLVSTVFTILLIGILVACSGNTNNQSASGSPSNGNAAEGSTSENQSETEQTKYPEKEIRIVIPYNPGGASDSTARTVAKIIKDEALLPVTINVVNLPGANTRIGLEEVLNAKNDGYTILLHHSTLNAMSAVGQLDISYEDYDLIAEVAHTPNVLVGPANGELKTFEQYVEAAKNSPGSISVGVPAIGSTTHLAFEALMQQTGNDGIFEVIPYQSGADLIAAHMGGQVDLRMASSPDSVQYVESGDVIPLASTSYDRHWHPEFKDAVSFKDLGLDVSIEVRFGFYAPKGTPQEVLNKLEDVLRKVVETNEFQQFAENSGLKAEFLSSEEMLDTNKKIQEVFNELAQNIDITN